MNHLRMIEQLRPGASDKRSDNALRQQQTEGDALGPKYAPELP
jgi:hypothetical protein